MSGAAHILAERSRLHQAAALTGLAALALATGWGGASLRAHFAEAANLKAVRGALELRLPKTPISRIDCKGFGGLCEVASNTTLFYVDPAARYLVIGRLYDMETRHDLTAARLLELNPDLLAAGAARRPAASSEGQAEAIASPRNVKLSGLPASGAIFWGPATGPRVTVFSDFHCAYCKRLAGELAALGARVEERPISVLGPASRKLVEQVLCAPDPAAALHRAYRGERLTGAAACDTKGLDANEKFAKTSGFGGTPVLVRPSDGAVLEGFREAAVLRAFLNPSAPVEAAAETPPKP